MVCLHRAHYTSRRGKYKNNIQTHAGRSGSFWFECHEGIKIKLTDKRETRQIFRQIDLTRDLLMVNSRPVTADHAADRWDVSAVSAAERWHVKMRESQDWRKNTTLTRSAAVVRGPPHQLHLGTLTPLSHILLSVLHIFSVFSLFFFHFLLQF